MIYYGIINLLSLIYLTAVVALVIGSHETETPGETARGFLGCWVKILGALVGLGIVVYIMSLFAG